MNKVTDVTNKSPITEKMTIIAMKFFRFTGWPTAVEKLAQESFEEVKPFEFVTRIEYSTSSPTVTE